MEYFEKSDEDQKNNSESKTNLDDNESFVPHIIGRRKSLENNLKNRHNPMNIKISPISGAVIMIPDPFYPLYKR